MENIGIMNEQLSLRMDNRLPELERLQCEVEAFLEKCGVCGRASYHIQLALDELVTNVIRYAFSAEGGHEIRLDLEHGPCGMEMTLTDGGKPFNPLEAPEPDLAAPAEDRPIGGLGIHFVRKTMDCLRYERRDGLNILHMRKMTS